MCNHCAIIEIHKKNVILPKKCDNEDIGLDIFSPFEFTLEQKEQKIIFLGFSVKPPINYLFQIKNNYSLMIKGIFIMSGIMKQGGNNSLSCIIKNDSRFSYTILKGQTIGKGIFVKCINPEYFVVNRAP